MTIIAHDHAHTARLENRALLPGVALAAMLAACAFGLHALPGIGVLSPMILSILLGIAFHNLLGTPARAKAGVTFAHAPHPAFRHHPARACNSRHSRSRRSADQAWRSSRLR